MLKLALLRCGQYLVLCRGAYLEAVTETVLMLLFTIFLGCQRVGEYIFIQGTVFVLATVYISYNG